MTFLQKCTQTIKEYRYPLIFNVVFAFIYVLPLLLTNVYYADDLRRAVNGVGWDYDGRYFSSFLMNKITAGGFISDYFPYSIIFSAIILSIGGYIISIILGLEKDRKYKLSSCILLINPFFLENLSYRWDTIPMSVSIVVLIIPFLFVSSRTLFVLSSIIGICITLFTYQASIVIYPLMAILILINHCIDDNKKTIESFILFICSFILGLIIYKLISLLFPTNFGGRDSIILFKENFLSNLIINSERAWELIRTAFSRYFKIVIVLSIFLCVISYIKYLISSKPIIQKGLIILLPLFAIILIPFIILILENVWIGPRILVGFSFLIYLMLIIINNLSQRIIPIISFLFIFISLPLMSAYASALKSQNSLEVYVSQKITQTVNMEDRILTFEGYLEFSPETYVAIDKFPIIKQLIRHNLVDNLSWGPKLFAKANNYMYFPQYVNNEKYEKIMENKNMLPVVDETYYYILRADSAIVLVDFNASKSKVERIVVD